jgi:hypothetical protein
MPRLSEIDWQPVRAKPRTGRWVVLAVMAVAVVVVGRGYLSAPVDTVAVPLSTIARPMAKSEPSIIADPVRVLNPGLETSAPPQDDAADSPATSTAADYRALRGELLAAP